MKPIHRHWGGHSSRNWIDYRWSKFANIDNRILQANCVKLIHHGYTEKHSNLSNTKHIKIYTSQQDVSFNLTMTMGNAPGPRPASHVIGIKDKRISKDKYCNVITARDVMNIPWRHISYVMLTRNKQTVARKHVYYRLIFVIRQVSHVERNNFTVLAKLNTKLKSTCHLTL